MAVGEPMPEVVGGSPVDLGLIPPKLDMDSGHFKG